MPNLKASIKANRASKARTVENGRLKRRYKNALKEFKTLVLSGNTEDAKSNLPKVYKLLDKAAKKGVLKENTASRIKSRMTKSLKPTEA